MTPGFYALGRVCRTAGHSCTAESMHEPPLFHIHGAALFAVILFHAASSDPSEQQWVSSLSWSCLPDRSCS
jgi:hypothetical protein